MSLPISQSDGLGKQNGTFYGTWHLDDDTAMIYQVCEVKSAMDSMSFNDLRVIGKDC